MQADVPRLTEGPKQSIFLIYDTQTNIAITIRKRECYVDSRGLEGL
jgi:hypothetical protein